MHGLSASNISKMRKGMHLYLMTKRLEFGRSSIAENAKRVCDAIKERVLGPTLSGTRFRMDNAKELYAEVMARNTVKHLDDAYSRYEASKEARRSMQQKLISMGVELTTAPKLASVQVEIASACTTKEQWWLPQQREATEYCSITSEILAVEVERAACSDDSCQPFSPEIIERRVHHGPSSKIPWVIGAVVGVGAAYAAFNLWKKYC